MSLIYWRFKFLAGMQHHWSGDYVGQILELQENADSITHYFLFMMFFIFVNINTAENWFLLIYWVLDWHVFQHVNHGGVISYLAFFGVFRDLGLPDWPNELAEDFRWLISKLNSLLYLLWYG